MDPTTYFRVGSVYYGAVQDMHCLSFQSGAADGGIS